MALTDTQLAKLPSTRNGHEFARMMRTFDRPSVISEGDSWFDYPPGIGSGSPSNIIAHIERKTRGRLNHYRLSSSGDELAQIMARKQRHRLIELLAKYAKRGTPIDVLLFSAGGNDVVGDSDLERFLRDYQTGFSAQQCIHPLRFSNKIKQLEYGFRELIDIRNQYSPRTVIITHTYDVPFITGKGAKYLGKTWSGPWLSPAMKDRRIPKNLQRAVGRVLIEALQQNLLKLSKLSVAKGRFLVADTVGTLAAEPEWLNEIHPRPAGFGKIAKAVYAEMRTVIPGLPTW